MTDENKPIGQTAEEIEVQNRRIMNNPRGINAPFSPAMLREQLAEAEDRVGMVAGDVAKAEASLETAKARHEEAKRMVDVIEKDIVNEEVMAQARAADEQKKAEEKAAEKSKRVEEIKSSLPKPEADGDRTLREQSEREKKMRDDREAMELRNKQTDLDRKAAEEHRAPPSVAAVEPPETPTPANPAAPQPSPARPAAPPA